MRTNNSLKLNFAPLHRAHKRLIFLALFGLTLIALATPKGFGNEAPQHHILVLGDSLSAAYGIPRQDGWVALLSEELNGSNIKVTNASISGETTDGGLRALPQLLDQLNPSLVLIELGANDGLRGFPITTIKQNLDKMIALSRQSQADVMLIGIHIPTNYGRRYTQAFHAIYHQLADQHNLALVPFLLDGVALKPELMQDDGLHPKSTGQPLMLDNVMQILSPYLSKRGV
jgi:acyl-CoA thioesterase-1